MKHYNILFILMLLANTAILQAQEGYTPRHYNPADPRPYRPPTPEETPEGYRYNKPMILGLISIADTANPASTFALYPNPAKDFVELHWDWMVEGLDGDIQIRIVNLTGQVMKSETVSDYAKNVHMLETPGFVPGIYLLSITDSEGNQLFEQKVTILK